MLEAYLAKSACTEWFVTLINTKNFILCCYLSLTVQKVKISREHKDGEKWCIITWFMKSEVGDIGPVKPAHMLLVTTRVFFQGSVENLAGT